MQLCCPHHQHLLPATWHNNKTTTQNMVRYNVACSRCIFFLTSLPQKGKEENSYICSLNCWVTNGWGANQLLLRSGTCAAYIIYAICFCAALILRTCEPHSAYVQNVRHKQNIGHMRKMCAGGIHCNMCAVCAQSSRYVQNMRSLRTILKICAVCAHNKKNKKIKKFSTGCWSPVQALGRPNVRVPVLSMWYGLRHLQLFKKTFYMCSYTA